MRFNIENNFTYHPPKKGDPEVYQEIRDKAKELAELIEKLCPDSRELSIAFGKVEEAVMWANAARARYKSTPTGPEPRKGKKGEK